MRVKLCVPIDIIDRGVCCLRPGLPGISETIRVRSIVDRFLEHSRIFVFGPDASAKVFLASADWMPRNFYRRVEVMFPVESTDLKDRILHEIIPAYLLDNVKTRMLHPDGSYSRIEPSEGQGPYRCQERLLAVRNNNPTMASENRILHAGHWGSLSENGHDLNVAEPSHPSDEQRH